MRPELQTVLDYLPEMTPGQLPELLGELEIIRATAMLRMTAPAPAAAPDEQLEVGAAAKRLGVSKRYLYQHAEQFAFTRREGRKLLFSGHGITEYISRKCGKNGLTAKRQACTLSLSSSR